MEYTYQNHLKFYIGDILYGFRTDPYQKYKVSLGKADLDYLKNITYKKELSRISSLIFNQLKNDFVLFFSGGTDSEIALRSFLSIGIKPKLIMLKMENNYNLHEIKYANKLANELDLKIEYIDINMYDFFYSGEAAEISKDTQCCQIILCALYKIIKKLNFPSLFGGSTLLTRNIKINPTNWYFTLLETDESSSIRFSKLTGIPVISDFFNYTPELMLIYLENPMIQNIINTRYNYKLKLENSKNNILKVLVPEISLRTKNHGLEKIIPFGEETYRMLASTFTQRLTDCLDGIPIDIALKMLKGTYETQ